MSIVMAALLTAVAYIYLVGAVGVYRAFRRDFRDDPWWACAATAVLWPVVLAIQFFPMITKRG